MWRDACVSCFNLLIRPALTSSRLDGTALGKKLHVVVPRKKHATYRNKNNVYKVKSTREPKEFVSALNSLEC